MWKGVDSIFSQYVMTLHEKKRSSQMARCVLEEAWICLYRDLKTPTSWVGIGKTKLWWKNEENVFNWLLRVARNVKYVHNYITELTINLFFWFKNVKQFIFKISKYLKHNVHFKDMPLLTDIFSDTCAWIYNQTLLLRIFVPINN